MFNEYIIVTM